MKKYLFISSILIFLLSSILHFGYVWWPNFFTSLIFPVNESIFEHNKIIIGSYLIFTIIESLYYKKNTIYANFITSIICILLISSLFTPIFYLILKTKDNIFITFIIYFLAIYLSQIIHYKLLKKESNKKQIIISIIGFIICYLILGILTYYPLHIGIFYDYNKMIYGRG